MNKQGVRRELVWTMWGLKGVSTWMSISSSCLSFCSHSEAWGPCAALLPPRLMIPSMLMLVGAVGCDFLRSWFSFCSVWARRVGLPIKPFGSLSSCSCSHPSLLIQCPSQAEKILARFVGTLPRPVMGAKLWWPELSGCGVSLNRSPRNGSNNTFYLYSTLSPTS